LFTNPDGLSLPDVWAPVFVESGVCPFPVHRCFDVKLKCIYAYIGVANYTYIPPSVPVAQSDWPTLSELIDAGTRVIVFLDAGADGADGLVDYILPEFQMVGRFVSLSRRISHMGDFFRTDLGDTIFCNRPYFSLLGESHFRPTADSVTHVSDQPFAEY
jgi:hypothetical protein